MGNVHMEAAQINYRGGEKKMSVEEAIKNAGNTGLAHTADIAPEFSTESAYNAGDFVYHNGSLYEFTANHAAGAWSTADTQAATISNELASLESGLTNLTRFVNLQSSQSITVDGAELLVVAKRQHEQTAYDVNAIMYLSGGNIFALLNNGGNTTPITVSYDTTHVTTTITNNNGVAINLVIITN